MRWLPSVRRFVPRHQPVLRLGLLGNATVGAVIAAATCWIAGDPAIVTASASPWTMSGLVSLFVGWASARWMTTESDKAVLRQAVCRAATAPAAHPTTIRTMSDTRSAEAIYDAVCDLVPRRAEHT